MRGAAELEEVDLVDAEAPPRRRVAPPGAEVAARADEAADDDVALGDELHDLHAHVGE
jgi:hypothetical protein